MGLDDLVGPMSSTTQTTPTEAASKIAKVVHLEFSDEESLAVYKKLTRHGAKEDRKPTAQVRHIIKKWAEGVK